MHGDIFVPIAAGNDTLVIPDTVAVSLKAGYNGQHNFRILMGIGYKDIWPVALIGHGNHSVQTQRILSFDRRNTAGIFAEWGIILHLLYHAGRKK